MHWLIRKSAALVAAYGIALQALFSGFVLIAQPGFDAAAVICTTGGSAEHAPSAPQHANDCGSCLAACSQPWAPAPASPALASLSFGDTSKLSLPSLDSASPRKRHQPQASRAPPVFS